MLENIKRFFLFASLGLFLFAPMTSLVAKESPPPENQGYTINFDNVPIQEFLKFVSKIAKVNVIYNETDLDFNVSIVSEEETNLQNVMSALVQVLRINGLTLIEEDQNFLIHRNDDVKQIPTVVSSEHPITPNMKPAIITKVFRIEQGNPAHIAALIEPMLSREAIVEVSSETRQLIITDVTSSLETVQDLLKSLDAPETPYDISTYFAKNISIDELAPIANQILKPLVQNTTLDLVLQPDTQTIYIVSTPFLIQKTKEVLNDIDKEGLSLAKRNLGGENVLVYKLIFKNKKAVEAGLKKIAKEAVAQGYNSTSLITTINNVKYVDATNALMFIGPPSDLKVISVLLKSVDIPSGASSEMDNSTFFLFEPGNMSADEMNQVLDEITGHLKKVGYTHPSVLSCIEHAQTIEQIDSILFTGNAETITEVKSLVSSVESSYTEELTKSGGSKFLIYNIKDAHEEQIRKSLNHLADYLESNKFPNEELIKAIDSMRWVKSTNSLMFTGNAKTLSELSNILPTFDVPPNQSQSALHQIPPSTEFVIYSPKEVSSEYLKKAVDNTAHNLQSADLADPALIKTLESVRTLPSSDQLIFTGDTTSLSKLSTILSELDQENVVDSMREGPYFIHLQHVNYSRVKNALKSMVKDLPKEDPIRELVDTMNYLPESNTIVFRGPQEAMKKVKEVIDLTDGVVAAGQNGSQVEFIPVESRQAQDIINILHETAAKLRKSGSASEELIETLESSQAMSNANTIIVTGTEANIDKVKLLISTNDSPRKAIQKNPGSNVEFVKVENRQANDLTNMLHETAQKLKKSGAASDELIQTLEDAQSMPKNNTIILSGTPEDLERAKSLITSSDVPYKAGADTEVYVYKLNYLTSDELKTSLQGIADHAHANNPSLSTDSLISTIDSMRSIPSSDAVQFVGPPGVIDKLKNVISILDTPENASSKVKKHLGANFLVFNVKHMIPNELLNDLKQLAKESPMANQDADLMKAVSSGRFAKDSNSLIFTGDKTSLDKINNLLTSLDTTDASHGTPWRKAEGYKLFKPEFVPGAQLVQMIKNFESHLVASGVTNNALAEVIDHVSFIPRTNTIIVTGPPKESLEVLSLLREFDNQETASGGAGPGDIETIDDTGFLIYKLQFQNGQGLVDALQLISTDLAVQDNQKKNQSLIEAIKSVQYISMTNTLMATGQPKTLTKLRDLLESLDRPQKQVFIEILVLETTIDKDLEFGLRWGSQGAENNKFSWATGSNGLNDSGGFSKNLGEITGSRPPKGSDIPPVEGGYFGVIGDTIWAKGKSYGSIGSMINAIKTDGDTTVVLSQKIICQDNQNAKIFSGSNVPFTGSLVTTSGLSQTTNANLEYRNIGITVNLTPIIGDNGLITLDIDHEISEEANPGNDDNSNVSVRAVNGIRTTRTSMTTRVNMPDKHFLVLSGTMRNQTIRSVSGIPCLGGLPLIGAAFNETKKQTENRNVVMFVKPYIINTNEDYENITEHQEELFGSQSQCNIADYYDGIETIRSPDDADFEDE